ncbi:MAG: cellobiose phosphorylase [Clostridiales bacterium]|nr:cellobiose phosphorylase [Clostridiales bacterium]
MSGLYHFSDDGNTCVITSPNTPRFWYNYLWNENGYCAQIAQTGQGRSYYIDEQANMCRINQGDARFIYIRDEESGEFWNIGKGPSDQPVDSYECRHSIWDSTIKTGKDKIISTWQIFVPQDAFHEMWGLTVRNEDTRSRTISIFTAVSFELEGFSYPRYYEMYRCLETGFDDKLNGIFCKSSHPFAPHKRYNGFLASSEKAFAYDGDLTAFCGPTQTQTRLDTSPVALFVRPKIVAEGLDCTGSEAALFIPGGVLQYRLTLEPGEEKEIYLAFGVCESKEEAYETVGRYINKEAFDKEYQRTKDAVLQKYNALSLHIPDEKLGVQLNSWIKKQVDFCIVGKKGVRDNLQIAVALLNFRQEKAEAEILECLRHQFKDGHTVLTWYPYDDTRYSDQPFWIIWAVCALIKETGDFSILSRELEWQDGGEGTVLEHVQAAVSCLLADKGRNGLIRIYFADWNDALNITTDLEAESVMLSEQACLGFLELSNLMEAAGDAEYAAYMKEQYEILKAAINEYAWDGEWYARALTKDGKIGSKDSKGSKIYLNAQTWAILGDVATEGRLGQVEAAIDSMEQDFGFPLNMPPYDEYLPETGRMSGMLPGLFENGGVYCHASAFKLLADCKLGRAQDAIRTLKKIMPDSDKNPSERSGAEPYVFTNCYATHPKYYGKSYQSWTTGTSAWSLRCMVEGILGVKRDYNGLKVEPCIPKEWEAAEITRQFRGAAYHIVIRNPHHKGGGEYSLTVDNAKIDGNVIPDFRDGKRHEVCVTLQ